MSDYSEAEQWERAKAWLQANAIWIVAGLVIGGLGLGGWRWYQDRLDRQAETASVHYEEMLLAFQRNDPKQGLAMVEDINRLHASSPYADLAKLMAARAHVDANELDKAAASLKSVMDKASDDEIRMIARMRYARVQSAQGKYDDALATLTVTEPGQFDTRLADVRGDVLLAKGDRDGALREYLAARQGENNGRIDVEMLDLKIRDLGGTPPPTAEES